MADDEDDGLASMWTVKLESVQRLDADDPDDQDDSYIVDLTLESPSANGSVSVMVSGGFNETRMIGQAREILRAALERWARVMAHRHAAEQGEPESR